MPPEDFQDDEREASTSALRDRLIWLGAGVRRVTDWAAANRVKTGLLAAAGLVLVVGTVALWFVIVSAGRIDQAAVLEKAMQALDSGEYSEARRLAERLREAEEPSLEALGGAAFVLGAITAGEADEAWRTERKTAYLVAARYLEEARDRGFPPGREAEGLFLLGKSLYMSDHFPQSRPVLREALKRNRLRKTEIYRLLAGAYLNDANPKYPEALEYNALYLADRMLPADERHQGLLQRARILLELGETAECLSTLDQIPEEAKNRADAMVMRARVLMHEAGLFEKAAGETAESQVEAAEKYHEAIRILRLAQGRATLATQANQQAMYLIGVCLAATGDCRAALAQFGRTCRMYADSPEAMAADFQVAELSRRLGRDGEALAAYRRVLKAVKEAKDYHNPWIALDDLRKRMLDAYRHYAEAENYEICLQLTWLFHPMLSRARSLELMAETCRAWGRSLLARAEHLPPSKAEPLARQGRQHLRRAGQAYARLAELQITTREYPDKLWASADCYCQGQDYTGAVEILREYLKNESRRRRPRALVRLGESLLALGRNEEALLALGECIEFHSRDAACFRARLVASQAELEEGNFQKAQKLLEGNLSGELAPSSQEWRDSLFALGRLLHTEGRYEEAVVRLEEAVTRYPDVPEALEGRYLIADSYRRNAAEVEQKLKNDLVEDARVARARKVYDLRRTALERYQEAQEALTRRQETVELTPLEKSMLRNCQFAIGDVLFDLKQYEEAAKVYSAATNRYQDTPEVLDAYVQMSRAYRELHEPDLARGALEQAKMILNRLEPTSRFTETTIYSKTEWADLLDWFGSL